MNNQNYKTIKLKIIILILLGIISSNNAFSQTEEKNDKTSEEYQIYKHSIDFSPISPLINIYGIHYNYHLTPKDELITGFAYMKISYDFGNTNSPALIIGYRRYLWRNLHIEYQIWPGYDNFYEKNEDKYYKSF